MKKTIVLLFASFFLFTGSICNAELTKKEQKQIEKDAKNAAKDYKADGWLVSPGALTIERQLERAYTMENEIGFDGEQMYIMGNGQSIGKTYDAAKKQALQMAKEDVISKIQSEIAVIVDSSVGNNELGDDDAESVTRVLSEGTSLSKANLGKVITVTELYRGVKGTKNKEVLVRVAYNYNNVLNAAKSAIKKDLEERGDALRERLNKILDNK